MGQVGSDRWDLIVVGAGPAGMLAAFRAAMLGLRVLVLEKNRKPGVKILMSGGTRCNLTHDASVNDLLSVFVPEQARFLRRAVHALTPAQVVEFFHAAGVPTKIESHNGKVFPASDRALDVQRALLSRMADAEVELQTGQAVVEIRRTSSEWQVVTPDRTWHAPFLLVTTGGRSYPGCGTTGDAYAWMETLGHTVVTPRPALVPLTSSDVWVTELSGLTLEDAHLRVVPAATVADFPRMPDVVQRLAVCRKSQRIERRSSLLFAHFGLTGPAAMDVSRSVTECRSPHDVRLLLDLLPDRSVEELQADLLASTSQQGSRTLARWLGESLNVPQRLAASLLANLCLDGQLRLAELPKAGRNALLAELKSTPITVTGSRGFAKAEVTAGGVVLSEVDPKTMASRRAPGLYLAGEILDVDGPIGGYNFQAAFSTGWLAAESIAAEHRATQTAVS